MKLKKILMSSLALAAAGLIIIPTATSCAGVSQDIIDNMVGKGDSTKFADGDHYSDQQIFNLAMSTKTGSDAFKAKLVDDILYKWYKDKIEDQTAFKDNWNKWSKDADKEYDDKVSSYKSDHKNDWEYYFQNEVLDPVGGTKDAFLRDKIASNIRTEIVDLVFKNKLLGIPNNYKDTVGYKYDERLQPWNGGSDDAINDYNNAWPKMDFFAQLDPSYGSNTKLANQYAIIQKYVFEKYMTDVKPISTAMCLWKYSAPDSGMETIYNANKIPATSGDKSSSNLKDDDTKGIKESYEYPAFKAPAGPSSTSPTASDKYFNFVKQGWTDNQYILDSSNVGKINISKDHTEDSATLMITESSKSFSSLDVTFAGAVADLWGAYAAKDSTLSNHLNNDYYNGKIANPDYIQDTDILNNFLFRNGSLPKDSGQMGKYCLDLSKIYEYTGEAKDAASDNFSSLLFNQASSPYAATKTKQGVRYFIPAVRLTNESNQALPYLLVRDSFGVHIVGLDCATYLSKATTKENDTVWDREAQVLKYRSMMETHGFSSDLGTGMDLSSKLKDYFKDNLNKIILEMLFEGTKAHTTTKTGDDSDKQEQIFTNPWSDDDAIVNTLKEIVNASNAYNDYYNLISSVDEATKKIFSNTTKYVDNSLISKSGNIISDVYKNGLANALPFALINGTSGDSKILIQNDHYDECKLVYGFDSNYWSQYTVKDPNTLSKDSLNTAKTKLEEALNKLKIGTDYKPNTSKSGSLTYSEHIIFERDGGKDEDKNAADAINFTIQAFGGSGNEFSNIVKYDKYHEYWSKDGSSLEQTYNDALLSMYKADKVLTSDTPISYYSSEKVGNMNTYKTLLSQAYENNINRVISGSHDFASESVTYQQTLAALYWLTKNNNENLIKQLRNAIPTNTSAVVAWNIKDLTAPYNESFNSRSTDQNSYNAIWGFNSSYKGYYDHTYQLTDKANTTDDKITSGYIDSNNYYHFAPMPFKTADGKNSLADGMGFVGIQTQTSSSELPSQISNIIFSAGDKHFYKSVCTAGDENPAANGQGCLYQYGSKDALQKLIENSYGIQEIKSYAKSIELAIPYNENYEKIITKINQGTKDDGKPMTIQDYKDLMKEVFDDKSNIINADMFKGFNFKKDGLGGVQVKNDSDGAGAAVKLDAGYARTYIIQINSDDLAGDKYSDVTDNLNKLLGNNDILKAIAVQYALKSDVQTNATRDVIGGKKITVFDRRFNDQLGSTWVEDWKRAN